MKYEWRKKEKELYLPKTEPTLIKVPKHKYFLIKGKGDPNKEDFSNRVGVLYNLSYTIRMMPKSGHTPDGYFEYTVYPLEGIWDLSEKGQYDPSLNKDEFIYTIMIRQPEFVTNDIVNKAKNIAKNKNDNSLIDEVHFEEMEDGLVVQMMHIGSFDEEPKSFSKMNNFLNEKGLKRRNLTHKEIYLSDPRRTKTSNLKTVLRYFVEE